MRSGPSDAIPVTFRKSRTVSMNEPLEAKCRVGLWIHLALLTDGKHAGNIFLSNILAVLPKECTEAERSFSCIRRIYTWPRNTMTTERLSGLAVIVMYENAVAIDRSVVREKFVALHLRRKTASSSLADEGSRLFLSAVISSILWRYKSLQCYSLQFLLPKSPCFGANPRQLKSGNAECRALQFFE